MRALSASTSLTSEFLSNVKCTVSLDLRSDIDIDGFIPIEVVGDYFQPLYTGLFTIDISLEPRCTV